MQKKLLKNIQKRCKNDPKTMQNERNVFYDKDIAKFKKSQF